MDNSLATLGQRGFCVIAGEIPKALLSSLRASLFQDESAGERCLLDQPVVRKLSELLKTKLIRPGYLKGTAVAIQAIAFDKTEATNWKVAWHQDLMFPFGTRVSHPQFELPVMKQGVNYARPPASVLDELLAVRLHLDDCDSTNGPLRVSPGTHQWGIIASGEIPPTVNAHGEYICLAETGDLLLMRPLLLHASSQATAPKHRRVLHLVYHSGEPIPEAWHRAV